MRNIIQLQSFRKNESRMYSGRDFGLDVRDKITLDEKDNDNENYIVIFPDDTMSINSSFFGGLFAESLIVLGEKKFREKYCFQNEFYKPIKKSLQNDIEEGIYDALNG